VTQALYILHYSAHLTKKSFPTDTGKLFTFQNSLVGAVGIELKATLKTRKLLMLLNGKNAKNIVSGERTTSCVVCASVAKLRHDTA